jgi:hypothetical protein
MACLYEQLCFAAYALQSEIHFFKAVGKGILVTEVLVLGEKVELLYL